MQGGIGSMIKVRDGRPETRLALSTSWSHSEMSSHAVPDMLVIVNKGYKYRWNLKTATCD